MRLLKTNLIKVYVLALCSEKQHTIEDLKLSLRENSIEDVVPDVLYKTLKNLEQNNLILNENGFIEITHNGTLFLEDSKKNLSDFISFLTKETYESSTQYSISEDTKNTIKSVIAFKTVPFRLDVINNSSETDFFKKKVYNNEAYIFEGRKLGKSLYYDNTKQNEYNYKDYGILFINSGLIEFLGFVQSYSQDDGKLILSKVIRLKSPITISEIRNNIRCNFNISQQKQEFYTTAEVKKLKKLILEKIQKHGYEEYDKKE